MLSEKAQKEVVRIRPLFILRKFTTQNIWAIWLLLAVIFVIGIICGLIGFGALGTWGDTIINENTVFDVNPHSSLVDFDSQLQQKSNGVFTGVINPFDSLYATIKLLKMGDLSVASANPFITAARFILPLVVSITVLLGFFTLLRRCFNRFRAYFFKNHTIVCGLGVQGIAYIKDAVDCYNSLKRDNLDILVIEKNPDNPMIKYCREEGITVFIGDATSKDILSQTRPWTAKEVFSFIPGDGQNISLVNTLADIFREKKMIGNERPHSSSITQKLNCYLSIENVTLQSQLMDRKFTFKNQYGESVNYPIDVDLRNSREFLTMYAITNGVCSFFVRNPLIYNMNAGETPEIIVFGAGHIGSAIISELASLGHFKNEVKLNEGKAEYFTPLKIHVYDKNRDAASEFYNRYPIFRRRNEDGNDSNHISMERELSAINRHLRDKFLKKTGNELKENCRLLPLPDVDFDVTDITHTDRLTEIAVSISNKKNVAGIIVALGDDSLSVSVAFQLEQLLSNIIPTSNDYSASENSTPKILVYYSKHGGFDTVFGKGTGKCLQTRTNVEPFCNWSAISFDQHTSNDLIDEVAIGINTCYNKHYPLDTITQEEKVNKPHLVLTKKDIDDSRVDWESRPVAEYLQNRQQALHNLIKLSFFGYSVAKHHRDIPDGYEPVFSSEKTDEETAITEYMKGWSEVLDVLHANAELLSRIEHQRWWAEHLMSSWHFDAVKNKLLKRHWDMVPFENIDDTNPEVWEKPLFREEFSNVQSLDLFAVQEMVFSFEHAGYFPIRKVK